VAPEMSEVRMVLRGESRTHRFLRARLTFLIAATVAVDAIATAAMYMLEHDDPRSGFDNVGGALFWASAQLTTVGSQLPNPVTTPGRVIAIALSIWAITVAATLAASLAAFFRARHVEDIHHAT
jgi:ion channel